MKTSFTLLQQNAAGKLPYNQQAGEYESALNAAQSLDIFGVDKAAALVELRELREALNRENLSWNFYKGLCLGVSGYRVCCSLIPYAIKNKLGHVYKIRFYDLSDFMSILHSWRYHGVTMKGLDTGLQNYGINDEVPYERFKVVIDSMWNIEPLNERIIFQNAQGIPVSIFGTQTVLNSSVRDSIRESVDLSTYETMCAHILTCMLSLPKSVKLLGVSEDVCYILDTTGRNEVEIVNLFTKLVFPRRYFFRFIQFTGEVTKIEDTLIL